MKRFAQTSWVVFAAVVLVACGTEKPKVVTAEVKQSDEIVVTAAQLKNMKREPAQMINLPGVEEATGSVAFNDDAITPVYSPHTGRITELLAKPGESIRQGEPLMIIDSPEVVDAENDFLGGVAMVAQAKAVLRQAERNRDRQERLVAGEAAAPKDLEQALTDVLSAGSDVQAAEAQIDTARQRLLAFGKTSQEIDQISLSRRPDRTTRVLAPLGGQIVARKVGPGQYVRPDNPDPLFTIADTSSMWLLAQVYESEISVIRVGERVELQVLALPGKKFPAQVSYIAPSVDPVTRRVAVRCVVKNTGGQLKPEMFASFRFQREVRKALMVPQRALVQEGNISVVWVVEAGNAGNRVSRRNVGAGAESDGRVEIRAGLSEGEQVVSDGALFLSSLSHN